MYTYDKIPAALKQMKRWVLWKLKETDKGRTTKVPINAKNGYGAKSNDPETWSTFEEAERNCRFYQANGLGFMLGNGIFGVDLDDGAYKKLKAGQITQEEYQKQRVEFEKIINEFVLTLGSFTEISQSGKGVHIICKGVLPQGNRRKGDIEMYDSARFFAMTGNVHKDSADNVYDRTEEIIPLFTKYLGEAEDTSTAYMFKEATDSLLTDEEVMSKMLASRNGSHISLLVEGQWEGLYESQSQADLAYCSYLAFWCGRNQEQMDRLFRASSLFRPKWDEKRGKLTYGQITINQACTTCKDVYTPAFTQEKTFNIKTGEVVVTKQYDLSDTGNAQRFIDRFGENLRYNFDRKSWMLWDGKMWIRDTKQLVKTQADILIEEMKADIIKEQDNNKIREILKNVKHLSSFSGKEAMLKEAMHIGSIPTLSTDYDKDINLINTLSGVVDLKTGKILPHSKSYMMSKCINLTVDTEHDCMRWKQFLKEIFQNDNELIAYIKKAVGYTLTGSVAEQCFFQCYGDGSNGKSVFLDMLFYIMGSYGVNTRAESILTRSSNNGSNASSDIARLNGARFVRTNEPNEGERFNEGLVKQLVGGDVTTARFLFGDEFDFIPTLKLWIATNYKIIIRGTDKGIWRRNKLIPFKAVFDESNKDKHLLDKLKDEAPAILWWAIQGAVEWYRTELVDPQAVVEENKIYKHENDVIESFISSEIIEDSTKREKAGDVYKAYAEWAKIGKEYCMSQTKFGREFSKRYVKKSISGYTYYIGLQLKKNDERYIYSESD